MQYTPNYNLRKPDYENVADIVPAVHESMDIIDLTMKTIKDSNANVYTTTNVGNAYSVTIPNLSTLTDGYPICVKFNAPSTGNITLNVNSLGAKNVIDYFKNRVSNVGLNLIVNLRYETNAQNFILMGKGGGGNALPSQILLDATATVNSGPIVGTISSKGTQIYTPTTADQTIAAGQYLSGPQIFKGYPDLVASNIISTANIGGIQGTAPVLVTSNTNSMSINAPSNTASNTIINLSGLSFSPKLIYGTFICPSYASSVPIQFSYILTSSGIWNYCYIHLKGTGGSISSADGRFVVGTIASINLSSLIIVEYTNVPWDCNTITWNAFSW